MIEGILKATGTLLMLTGALFFQKFTKDGIHLYFPEIKNITKAKFVPLRWIWFNECPVLNKPRGGMNYLNIDQMGIKRVLRPSKTK